jgi:hypothetical protein
MVHIVSQQIINTRGGKEGGHLVLPVSLRIWSSKKLYFGIENTKCVGQ